CGPASSPSPAAGATPAGAAASGGGAAVVVPAPYTGMKNPFSASDAATVSAGQAIYAQRCQTCHGDKGDGKGPAGSALNPPPANFTASPFKEKFATAQADLFWRVSEGWPGTAMPAFKAQLSDEQRWQVITYEWKLSGGQ
ncbi:MAG: cytochrome c, partial [Dehalococcoidia bacterium]|nr:cytochrome c [Dehalococcoidia bacterium]